MPRKILPRKIAIIIANITTDRMENNPNPASKPNPSPIKIPPL
jgi:hypothetical protein